jgi:hypothetical protein
MTAQRKTHIPYGKPYAQRFIPFPVLTVAKEGERHDGYANFLSMPAGMKGSWTTPKVRIVTKTDLTREALAQVLNPRDHDLVFGALELRTGMRNRDRNLVRSAYQKLWTELKLPGDPSNSDLLEFFSQRPWSIHYPQAVTKAMAGARPVLWQHDERYQFAFYCADDWKAAAFLGFVLERMRLCPCGNIFYPSNSKVWHCNPGHAAYYRLKRWRDKQKTKREKTRPKPHQRGQ